MNNEREDPEMPSRDTCWCGQPTNSKGWLCTAHDSSSENALRNIAKVIRRNQPKKPS